MLSQWIGVLARMAVVGTLVLMTVATVPAQPAQKPSEEEVNKAREEVKKLTADLEKASDQWREAIRKLGEAREKLNKLEGRPSGRFPPFGPGRFGPGERSGRPEPPRPPAGPADAGRNAELEKKLDRIARDLEELRREIRRPATPPRD